MVQRTDCKYYQTKIDRYKRINGYRPKLQRNHDCKIKKMIIGGCKEDCKWFEPRGV
jgi:hypothetical protein